MTRFYKKPVLLIEFDPNKSFSLQVSVCTFYSSLSVVFMVQEEFSCLTSFVEMLRGYQLSAVIPNYYTSLHHISYL